MLVQTPMKLSISVEGDPAAIEGILARVLEHIRAGEAFTFKSAIHPESGMGVEGFLNLKGDEAETQIWREALDLLEESKLLRLEGLAFVDWLKQKVKQMDIPEEQQIPIFAQLYTMAHDQGRVQSLGPVAAPVPPETQPVV
jgi:hypothetical protein